MNTYLDILFSNRNSTLHIDNLINVQLSTLNNKDYVVMLLTNRQRLLNVALTK